MLDDDAPQRKMARLPSVDQVLDGIERLLERKQEFAYGEGTFEASMDEYGDIRFKAAGASFMLRERDLEPLTKEALRTPGVEAGDLQQKTRVAAYFVVLYREAMESMGLVP